jgi:hypothetical protein
MNQRTRGSPLPADGVTELRALVARVGVRRAAEMLGLSPNALRQALAGLPVIYGTLLAVELGLARVRRDEGYGP